MIWGSMIGLGLRALTQSVHVPNNQELRFWVIVIMTQVWGKYMIIRYLHPRVTE